MSMLPTVRLLQEKRIEQGRDEGEAFIDLKKSFDSIERVTVLDILKEVSNPERFMRMLSQVYGEM